MRGLSALVFGLLPCVLLAACGRGPSDASPDLLLLGGTVHDGSGAEPFTADVAVSGETISFVGDASAEGVEADDTVDVSGLMVTPGFIDMHSHAELDEAWGSESLPFLYQGITTVVLGVDGGGTPEVADRLALWERQGIGTNALTYVGHGAVRRRVMGEADRAPTADEMEEMKALVRTGMAEGAFGFSTGLFYVPGTYAATGEVIELATAAVEAAGPEGSIYDTHDRDLGAVYRGVGYLASIREGIRITGASGSRGIFSHFNAQGARNYGRAPEGAALIDSARAAGVRVAGAQHVYTATQSNLRSYTIPDWAAAGGDTAMIRRF
ncbi:MAG TPA: amidohydrolase family protein, partial [Longimicrobiales bacterium]|nr:amidohydrolase family protein [Longimicrobiales bacterium]